MLTHPSVGADVCLKKQRNGVSMRSLAIALVLFVMSALAGCADSDLPSAQARQAAFAELSGLHKPDSSTKQWIAEAGKYPGRENSVALHEDGTFRMSNMPDWWRLP